MPPTGSLDGPRNASRNAAVLSPGCPTPTIIVDSQSSSTSRAAVEQNSRSTKKRRVEKNEIETIKSQYLADKEKEEEESDDEPEEPTFKKFKCRWRNCAAELHNFDNLQRHVTKAHRKQMPYGVFSCHWAGCNQPVPEEQKYTMVHKDGVPESIPLEFNTVDDWWSHVSTHLQEVKEFIGLGPAVLPTDAESISNIDYMSDPATGQPITPVTRPAPRGYRFNPPPGFKPNRQFNVAHGISPAERGKAQKNTTAYTQAKERIRALGAGLDGGEEEVGDLLANDDGEGIGAFVQRWVHAEYSELKQVCTTLHETEGRKLS